MLISVKLNTIIELIVSADTETINHDKIDFASFLFLFEFQAAEKH